MISPLAPAAGWPRRAIRVVGWNVLIAVAGLAIAMGGAEIYLRLTWPFAHKERPTVFVPGVGPLIRPGAEVRWTDRHDFWTVSRANGLGFLDREPIDPRRAAESCHIAMIGGSLVEAPEVPIAGKFHVQFEELAARALPSLDVTTQAWGVPRTGMIAQLPLYDAYARRMKPKILVLVVFIRDFHYNVPLHWAYRKGHDPDHHPFVTAVQAENGAMILRPPSADGAKKMQHLAKRFSRDPLSTRAVQRARPYSFLAEYVWKRYALDRARPPADYWSRQREAWIETLRQRPDYAWILPPRGSAEEKEWRSSAKFPSLPTHLPRVRKYFFDFTAFGIDRFKERADSDGSTLVILQLPLPDYSSYEWAGEAFQAAARERGVPLIDLHDYISRQRRDVWDSRWTHDENLNAAGHLWAAGALLEWLARNRHACGTEDGPRN